MAKAPEYRGQEEARPVGIVAPRGIIGPLGVHSALTRSIRSKGSRYGKLDEPYILAVNSVDDTLGHRHIMDALFGAEQIVHQGGRVWQGRAFDGAFGAARQSKFTRVSAVLVVSNLVPWSVAQSEPVLYCNPWCSKPEPSVFCRLGRADPPEMMEIEREAAPEIFGLGADWPGFD